MLKASRVSEISIDPIQERSGNAAQIHCQSMLTVLAFIANIRIIRCFSLSEPTIISSAKREHVS